MSYQTEVLVGWSMGECFYSTIKYWLVISRNCDLIVSKKRALLDYFQRSLEKKAHMNPAKLHRISAFSPANWPAPRWYQQTHRPWPPRALRNGRIFCGSLRWSNPVVSCCALYFRLIFILEKAKHREGHEHQTWVVMHFSALLVILGIHWQEHWGIAAPYYSWPPMCLKQHQVLIRELSTENMPFAVFSMRNGTYSSLELPMN